MEDRALLRRASKKLNSGITDALPEWRLLGLLEKTGALDRLALLIEVHYSLDDLALVDGLSDGRRLLGEALTIKELLLLLVTVEYLVSAVAGRSLNLLDLLGLLDLLDLCRVDLLDCLNRLLLLNRLCL